MSLTPRQQKIRYFIQDIELFLKKIFLKLLFRPCKKIPVKEIDLSKVKRILVVRQNDPMGDIILSTPAIPSLKKALPNAIIDVLTRPDVKAVFEGNKFIDEIFVFNKNKLINPFYLLLLSHTLKNRKYDLVIVLGTTSVSFFSLFLAWKSGAPVRTGIDGSYYGKKIYTDAFLTTPVPFDGGREHQTVKNLNILKFIGIASSETDLYMDTTPEEDSRASEIVRGLDGMTIGIHTGAGKLENRWPIVRFAAVADSLHKEFKEKIVLFTGPKEAELTAAFLKAVKVPVTVIPALSLRDFTATVKKLSLLICNDTGVLHIAAAVGTKTVAVFGPTNPEEWNPLGVGHLYARAGDEKVKSVGIEEVCAKAKQSFQK